MSYTGRDDKDTAMGAAFIAAGYEPPDVRLDRLIVEAIARTRDHAGQIHGQVMGAVRHDLPLLWELTKDTRDQCLRDRVKKVRDRLAVERAKAREAAKEQQNTAGPVDGQTPDEAAGRSSGVVGQFSIDTQNPNANHAGVSYRPMTAGEARAQGWRAANEFVLKAVSRLDTFTINGKPLRDCTVAEGLEWAKAQQELTRKHAINARFVLRLASGIPSNGLFGYYWKGKEGEVNELFEKTEKEYEDRWV